MRLMLAAAALLLAIPAPAAAHGGSVAYRIVGDGAGRVRVGASWADDGVRVAEPLVVTLSGYSAAGVRVGPARLTEVSGQPGVYALAERLAQGSWTLTAESANPYLGYGTTTLAVGTSASGFPELFPPAPAGGSPRWPAVVLVVLVVLLAGTGVVYALSRRSSPSPSARRRSSR